MKYIVRIEAEEFEIEIVEKGDSLTARHDGREYPVSLLDSARPHYVILLGNTVLELEAEKSGAEQEIRWRGKKYQTRVEDKRLAQIKGAAAASQPALRELRSPLPGVVVKVEVKEEQEVQAGQGILILEAMKMENEIKSPFAGRIKKVLVQERQTVERNQSLVVLAGEFF